jgi:transcriptional regulator with XRE-family HTH domain
MDFPLRRTLGANLAALLDARRISQASLAAAIGKSQSTVSQILHGKASVTVDTIEAIAVALHVSYCELLVEGQSSAPAHAARRLPLPAQWNAASPEVRSLVTELLQLTAGPSQGADWRPRAVHLVATLVSLLNTPAQPRDRRRLS